MIACNVCNTPSESELIPCNICLDHVTSRLKNLKMYLKPELMNEILQIGFHFCRKKYGACQLCETTITQKHFDTKYSEITSICYDCGDEIMKRAILLYNRKESISKNLDRGYYCYLSKLSIKIRV